MAAVNGEVQLYLSRFQLSETLEMEADARKVDANVNSVTGCLITDNRNVLDKLETEVTDIELRSMKSAQITNQVNIRWVHGEAQLSNGLTKANEYKELLLFYRMHHRWRIVEDDAKASARRRKMMGLAPLEVKNVDTGDSELKEESCSFADDALDIWLGLLLLRSHFHPISSVAFERLPILWRGVGGMLFAQHSAVLRRTFREPWLGKRISGATRVWGVWTPPILA